MREMPYRIRSLCGGSIDGLPQGGDPAGVACGPAEHVGADHRCEQHFGSIFRHRSFGGVHKGLVKRARALGIDAAQRAPSSIRATSSPCATMGQRYSGGFGAR